MDPEMARLQVLSDPEMMARLREVCPLHPLLNADKSTISRYYMIAIYYRELTTWQMQRKTIRNGLQSLCKEWSQGHEKIQIRILQKRKSSWRK
jgi:hypothetical protein